jgi:DNA-binding response OmpR family regulator
MPNARVLIIEDEPVTQLLLAETLKSADYQVFLADSVTSAWEMITAGQQKFDVLLLDRQLPDMDGLSLLKRLKTETGSLQFPVILQTSLKSAEDIETGLQAGAYYYLTKPFHHQTLLALVCSAIKDFRANQQILEKVRQTESQLAQLAHLQSAEFNFRTPKQAREIAAFLANACPVAEKVVIGLSELMLNAVEHGNLGISYAEKSQLLREKRWLEEIENRLQHPDYTSRTATVAYARFPTEIRFRILDEGAGFDWRNYLDMQVERAFDLHGRGIAMANLLSFDALEYLGKGNELLAVVKL